MMTFVLIHGAGDSAWYWHLVEPELRKRGHDVVAMDLPCDDDSAGLAEYADTVVDASDSEGISSWLRNHLVASLRHSSVSAHRSI